MEDYRISLEALELHPELTKNLLMIMVEDYLRGIPNPTSVNTLKSLILIITKKKSFKHYEKNKETFISMCLILKGYLLLE